MTFIVATIVILVSSWPPECRPTGTPTTRANISIQHYLVNMVHKILTSVDENDSKNSIGVLLQMINWTQAFDWMSQKLGIESFLRNRVRPSLIPILIRFFQDRKT